MFGLIGSYYHDGTKRTGFVASGPHSNEVCVDDESKALYIAVLTWKYIYKKKVIKEYMEKAPSIPMSTTGSKDSKGSS